MIDEYITRFKKLNTDKSPARWSAITNHRAPHKALLLLAIMDLFAEGTILRNAIEASPELGELFTLYWSKTARPGERGNIALPFFHLISDGFWHLEPQSGKEAILAATRQIRSFSQLQELVKYARLDDELFDLFSVEAPRNLLRAVLINAYFAPEVQGVLVEQGRINIDAYRYSNELLEHATTEPVKETRDQAAKYSDAARSQGFRRAIIIAYESRCALCGIRIITSDGHTAVDAAHIVPWSVSYDDDPRNGIALCRLCHWTFDEGLLSISTRYSVLTSPQLAVAANLPRHLLTLNNQPIIAPQDRALWPDLNALHYHRVNVFRIR